MAMFRQFVIRRNRSAGPPDIAAKELRRGPCFVVGKNKWGRSAIKLYVDNDNKPHFEVYDPLGRSIIYELKLPRP